MGFDSPIFMGFLMGIGSGFATSSVENTAMRFSIQFGNNENQIYHAFRHTDALGLDRSLVKSAIEKHFKVFRHRSLKENLSIK